MNTPWATRQREMLARNSEWVREQGGSELPVQLDTYLKHDQKQRLNWLKSYAHGRVLEVGCSWGYVLAHVDGTCGVDINPHLLDVARLLSPSREFVCADARTLPFGDDEYDTVILSEVLEHLPWPAGVATAIGEATRVAKYQILATVPSPHADEAESFKHMWLAGPEEQSVLKRMLSQKTTVEKHGDFIYYRTLL